MSENKLKVILTGATGMVGEGVLHECLLHPDVEKVLVVGRKPYGLSHPKLQELLHNNFFDLSSIENQLQGYNACFFCLGVSSVGMDKDEYYKLTYTLTMHFAETLAKQNADLTFCYISGGGTDENGKMAWARVKGKTEKDLMQLPFKQVYAFRPGYLHPTKGLKNTQPYYKYIDWLYPVFRIVFAKHVSTLKQLGLAMINATKTKYNKQVIEVKDIHILAE
ncbi:Rossmann-fold NAD(P)-binding domain-containing protein [Solitalea koreensis]|uniref:NAD dependent epimerase/dehydratase family protein n=1 Tax=Solitalea koreensis TaxID=543615 RepID=A0A521BQS5_9SPHI|nr:epimerase [Solitalea koreensis]SMO49506.1 hypothetical protein SAMN06265350_102463 [Solitalea koreensis]